MLKANFVSCLTIPGNVILETFFLKLEVKCREAKEKSEEELIRTKKNVT